MTDKTELFEFLYDKCYESPELLDAILREYVHSLSESKLTELEDFLTNNFGDD
jgi:dsDNA-binding SOS-regulon protein